MVERRYRDGGEMGGRDSGEMVERRWKNRKQIWLRDGGDNGVAPSRSDGEDTWRWCWVCKHLADGVPNTTNLVPVQLSIFN